jgi:gliding motility-associated-like protein
MIQRGVIILLIVLPTLVRAQYTSNLGRFEVDQIKGCAPLTVNILNFNLVTTDECTGDKPCGIFWGDGTPEEQNSAEHTYQQPGTYTLRVLYQTIHFDTIKIVVTPNIPPSFNLFTCGGNEVQVNVTDTNYDGYIIDFGDGTEVQVPQGSVTVNHTYANSNVQTISVRGKDTNADDNCSVNQQNFQPRDALPTPFINELQVVGNNQITLELTTLANIQYRLEMATNNNTTFQLVQTVYNSTTETVNTINTANNFYCFRLGAFDPCNNTTSYSNIICGIDFNAVAQNNQNDLSWTTNTTGIGGYQVLRDDATIGTPAPPTAAFVDTNVICNTSYCYQLIANYTNSSRSISMVNCITAFSSDIPTPITNATSTVTASGVEIAWQQDPAFQAVEYSIFRKEDGGNYQLLGKTTTTSFSDNVYTSEKEFCYQIKYVDACENEAPLGTEICMIRLTGDLTPENYVNLSWTAYTGWENGVSEYVIEKYSAGGQLLQTIPVSAGTTTYLDMEVTPDHQVIHYVIKANPNNPGLGQAVSNAIEIKKEPRVTYPTAFTPDNQGPVDNEVFKIYTQYIASYELFIFNRWGELIYTTRDKDIGWDGTFKGQDVPDGTYAFTVRLTDLTGHTFTHSASVLLLRKR